MRVISDNAIDRANLSSISSAVGWPLANLQAPRKSDVWRAVGTTAALRAAWLTPEILQAVVLPFCNLSPTATMRVRATTEPQATNLMPYSSAFGDASWGKSGCGLVGGITAPDGSTGATAVVASSTDPYVNRGLALTSGTYTFSVFLRGNASTVGKVPMVWIWNQNNLAGFTAAADARALTNGWVRYSATCTVTTSGTYQLRMDLPDTATVGDVVHMWGVQVETGSIASSYYPTTTVAATRPLGYIDSWQSYAYDSGAQLACPAPAVRLRGFTAAASTSAYAFGGGTEARLWMPAAVQAYGLAVDIVDTANLQGYVEAAYLVAGPYWEPALNVDYGSSSQWDDLSKSERNDAGDSITDLSTKSKKLSLPMSKLDPTDSNALWDILTSNGTGYPVYVSILHGHSDFRLERRLQAYGKLVQTPAMVLPFFRVSSATLEIQSV